MNINLAKLSGGMTVIPREMLDGLKSRIRGPILTERDDGYTAARSVWNAMIDRRPAIIVRCAGAADVKEAVRFARDAGGVLSVRGGGHNIAGSAVCDSGVLIDLSLMKSVHIDPFARTARVEPGVTLGEFDREAQSFGLVTPTGINSTTGIAGLTLGGGFGWISRKFGLTAEYRHRYRRWAPCARERCRELGPILGDPRRRRQFRGCHLVRVPPAPARPGGHVGPDRVPVAARRSRC
jgi:hypothetical protein